MNQQAAGEPHSSLTRLDAPPNRSVQVTCPYLRGPDRYSFSLDKWGNTFVFDLEEDSTVRIDAAGLQWGTFVGSGVRRPLAAAATADGKLWFAGQRDTSSASAGTFIAKHETVLDDGSSWEREDDTGDLMWTALGVSDGGAVVVGHRDMEMVVAGLDLQGSLLWERAYPLGIGLRMQHVVVTAEGEILTCGTRLLPPAGQPRRGPVVLKLGWKT